MEDGMTSYATTVSDEGVHLSSTAGHGEPDGEAESVKRHLVQAVPITPEQPYLVLVERQDVEACAGSEQRQQRLNEETAPDGHQFGQPQWHSKVPHSAGPDKYRQTVARSLPQRRPVKQLAGRLKDLVG